MSLLEKKDEILVLFLAFNKHRNSLCFPSENLVKRILLLKLEENIILHVLYLIFFNWENINIVSILYVVRKNS